MGWEHETQLGYAASKGRGRFEKIDMDSCICEVESSPHPSDSAADNQYAVDGITSRARIQAVLLCIRHGSLPISLYKLTAGEFHQPNLFRVIPIRYGNSPAP